MSLFEPPTYKLKERLYENNERTIVIFRTRRKKTIKYIAVKVYYKIKHPFYNREYSILKDIDCPSIIHVSGASEDKNNFYMEMEYCLSGDLSHCLWPNKRSNYMEKVIRTVTTQLLIGLRTLHSNGIIHCNIKPSNILIDEFGNVRICDFKKALKINEMTIKDIKKNKTAMTPCYTAPELFSDVGEYSFKTDLWALGCIMYEMAVGQVPFFDEIVNRLIKKIMNEEVNFNKKQFNRYSEEFMEVLKELLEKDPEKRPSWGTIEYFSFWNVNEKGFSTAFPNININNGNNINNSNSNISNINLNLNLNNVSVLSGNINSFLKDYNGNNNDIINISPKGKSNINLSNRTGRVMSAKTEGIHGNKINQFNISLRNNHTISKNGIIIKKLDVEEEENIKNNNINKNNSNKNININDYINNENDIDDNDREFKFQVNDNNSKMQHNEEESYLPNKFANIDTNYNLLSLSVLNVSKILDRKEKIQKNNTANEMTLSLANPEELPQIEYLMMDNSDKNVKPIIGNKIIEPKRLPVLFDERKIPFKPIYRIEQMKDMLRHGRFKEFDEYLKKLYFILEDCNHKQKFDILLNLLNYFETIILSKDISNNIVNTSFVKLFINFLEINDDKIRIRICSIIAYLIRYSTNLNISLDNYNLTEILISFIADTNLDLNRKAMSTLGEYLFFVSTQVEIELSQHKKSGGKLKWSIKNESLKALLFALNHIDEKVRFYSLKSIENICTLTNISKKYFATTDDFISKIIDIINFSCENPEIKTSAYSTVSHIIRHNPTLLKIFINKMDKINIVIENETTRNQQYIINSLLFGIEGDRKNLRSISKNELMPSLINLLETSNNVIKCKIVLLLSMLFNDMITVIKYGEAVFNLIQQLNKEKNIFYYHIKIFEASLKKNCESLIKVYRMYSEEEMKNMNNNIKPSTDKLLSLLKCFNIIAPYQKISYALYNKEFLNISINLLSNCNLTSQKSELLFELLKVFSENEYNIRENCDFIINKLFMKILSFTNTINEEYRRFPLNICANILTTLLEDESLYSSTLIEEGKTSQINKLIIDILPEIYDLLINQDLVHEILAFLSLIIERNVAFIQYFRSNGIIDYIFVLMKQENFYSNLNLIKIIIKLIEFNETSFNDIIELGLIDKINYLIRKDNSDEITIYTEYVIEMFFDLMFKLNEMKREYSNNHNKEEILKNFTNKIEAVALNFKLSIRLLSCDNFNLQEKSCVNLIFILQFFPNCYIKSINVNVKFTEEDIPDLLKALDSGNKKIYKKMIKIFKWIIECQNDAKNILKNYVSYIQICIEKIINVSEEKDVIEIAKDFLQNNLPKIF